MNLDEAKDILRACHLGETAAEDPQFRDAFELVKRDPALAEWFACEQELDSRISGKVRSFPVPPDLKGRLLAARKVVAFPVWWQRPGWIVAMAACTVLFLGLVMALARPAGRSQFDDFRSFVATSTANLDHLDLRTKDVAEARQWLARQRAPDDFTIPASLDQKPSIGCRVFDWKGQRVSLVCFKIEGGHEVHLFVSDCTRMRGAPHGKNPEYRVVGGIATASWSNNERAYVLATDQGEPVVRRLLL